mmetsp:Transcript_29912/g.87370  ORF Transcript_29912/g.87370 Transcript_29912/m.87370 type:complete len:370 (-) Transcript_29912:432-1541(-)
MSPIQSSCLSCCSSSSILSALLSFSPPALVTSTPASLLTSANPENGFQWYGRISNRLSGGSPGLPVALFSALAHTSSRSSIIAAIVPPQGNTRLSDLTSLPRSLTSVRETMREPNSFIRSSLAFFSRRSASPRSARRRFTVASSSVWSKFSSSTRLASAASSLDVADAACSLALAVSLDSFFSSLAAGSKLTLLRLRGIGSPTAPPELLELDFPSALLSSNVTALGEVSPLPLAAVLAEFVSPVSLPFSSSSSPFFSSTATESVASLASPSPTSSSSSSSSSISSKMTLTSSRIWVSSSSSVAVALNFWFNPSTYRRRFIRASCHRARSSAAARLRRRLLSSSSSSRAPTMCRLTTWATLCAYDRVPAV